MTISATVICPSTPLPSSSTTLYSSQANGTTIIRQAVFTNTDTATHTITVYRVPAGGSPGAGNILINAQKVSAGQAYVSPELSNVVLTNGDYISALADTASLVNATMFGFTQ